MHVNLLYFSAGWCAPCRQLKPVIDSIETDYADYDLVVERYDVDEDQLVAKEWFIRSVPTVVIVADGEEHLRFAGYRSDHNYRAILDSLLKGEGHGD